MTRHVDFVAAGASQYAAILREVLVNGERQRNERTGAEVIARLGLRVEIPFYDGLIPLPGLRRQNPTIPAVDVAWWLSGAADISWVRHWTKVWDPFAEKRPGVGESYSENYTVDVVEAAYGYRWRHAFGRDQIAEAIDHLHDFPNSRQCVVVTWDPSSDGMNRTGSRKMVPCPFAFQLAREHEGLSMILSLRSSDLVVGLPVDWFGFALLLDAIASSIGVPPCRLVINIGHAHVYVDHVDVAREMIDRMEFASAFAVPGWSESVIVFGPDAYVALIRERYDHLKDKPTFAPKVKVTV